MSQPFRTLKPGLFPSPENHPPECMLNGFCPYSMQEHVRLITQFQDEYDLRPCNPSKRGFSFQILVTLWVLPNPLWPHMRG